MQKHNFRNLDVWKLSKDFCKDIYIITNQYPSEEKFGIVSQMRRSVISIPSNIAEGTSRGSNKDFSRFLDIGLGSAYELETQIMVSYDLEFIKKIDFGVSSEKIQQIQKMIIGLQNKLIQN